MFYGLDVHKEFIQVCELTSKERTRREFRIAATNEAIEAFAQGLSHRDHVVLEATFHSWAIYRLLKPHAGKVVVANPLQVKAIAHAKIKTDKVDAHTLAELLRADFLPTVEMPDEKTWALRQLVSHRRFLVKQQTAAKNTIRGVLNRRLIVMPDGTPFSAKARRWMRKLALPVTERFLLDNALDLLEQVEARVAAADEQLLRHASVEQDAQLLMTIPGIHVTVSIGVLSAIGDVRRFPTPGQMAAYLGVVPRVSQSAGRCYHGRITKAGNSNARSLLIEAAQALARSSSPLTATYHRVRRKRGHNVAVTALARKMVTVIWHMLHNHEPYRYAPVPRTWHKLRSVVPRPPKARVSHLPRKLEEAYQEAGLPPLTDPSSGERRAAANNRRTRTRLARQG